MHRFVSVNETRFLLEKSSQWLAAEKAFKTWMTVIFIFSYDVNTLILWDSVGIKACAAFGTAVVVFMLCKHASLKILCVISENRALEVPYSVIWICMHIVDHFALTLPS